MDPENIVAGLRERGYKVNHTYADAGSWPPAQIELELPEGETLSDELRWFLRHHKDAIVVELQRETLEDYADMVETAMSSADAALAPGNPHIYADSGESSAPTDERGVAGVDVGIVGIVGISITCCLYKPDSLGTTIGGNVDNPDNPDTLDPPFVDWGQSVVEMFADPPAWLPAQAKLYLYARKRGDERLLAPTTAAVRLAISLKRSPDASPTDAIRAAPSVAELAPVVESEIDKLPRSRSSAA
jgi:hypothetical protein